MAESWFGNMTLIANLQSFNTAMSGIVGVHTTKFKDAMDALLIEGYDLILDLPAARQECPTGCRFNQTYKQYMDETGGKCRECKGTGFVFETRQTQYKCNRRWTNEPLDQALSGNQATQGGRIYGNFVRVKTVIESFNHIQDSLGATLDGVKIKLYREPRKTGWANTNLYVISWWERANKTNG